MRILFKESPIFFSILILLVCSLGTETFFVFHESRKAALISERIEANTRAFMNLAEAVPAPSITNLEEIEINLRDLEIKFDDLLRGLNRNSLASISRPDKPLNGRDVLFDLTEFIAAYRKRAAHSGVRLPDGESFGFSQLIAAGQVPQISNVGRIYQQRLIIGVLLDQLLEAGPREILAVQREEISATRRSTSSTGDNVMLSDFFELDPQIAFRTSGIARTMGFRITFTGHTGALRSFLTRLSALDMALIVDSVEVKPMAKQQRERPAARTVHLPFQVRMVDDGAHQIGISGAEPVPIISDNLSQFTVTMEYLISIDMDQFASVDEN